jgi:hypothetical protein
LIDTIPSVAVENLYPAAEINRLHDRDAVVGALDHDSIAVRSLSVPHRNSEVER